MYQIALFVVFVLLTSASVAADKPTSKGQTGEPPTALTVEQWQPTAFGTDVGHLQPGYEGLNPVKFFEMFIAKIGTLESKGEFETSKEFAQRTANKELLLSPINTSDLYAFRIQPISIKYDADTQSYFVDKSCTEAPKKASEDWFATCHVVAANRSHDTYVGSNAYGASRVINRTRGVNFSLAIAKSSRALSAPSSRNPYLQDQYPFQDQLSIPLEKARSLKDMTIAILFVGRVIDATIAEGRSTSENPTIDSPTDTYILNYGVPFDLKKVIYYIVQTGEILGQRVY